MVIYPSNQRPVIRPRKRKGRMDCYSLDLVSVSLRYTQSSSRYSGEHWIRSPSLHLPWHEWLSTWFTAAWDWGRMMERSSCSQALIHHHNHLTIMEKSKWCREDSGRAFVFVSDNQSGLLSNLHLQVQRSSPCKQTQGTLRSGLTFVKGGDLFQSHWDSLSGQRQIQLQKCRFVFNFYFL